MDIEKCIRTGNCKEIKKLNENGMVNIEFIKESIRQESLYMLDFLIKLGIYPDMNCLEESKMCDDISIYHLINRCL